MVIYGFQLGITKNNIFQEVARVGIKCGPPGCEPDMLVTSTPISELTFRLVFHFTMFPPTSPHDSTCNPNSTHVLLIRLIDGSAGNIS